MRPIADVRRRARRAESSQSACVKSFGRRQAYESPRGRNPRATGRWLWGFRSAADVGNGVTAVWRPEDGLKQAAGLPVRALHSARHVACRERIGGDCRVGRAWIHCRKRRARGRRFAFAMPGHGLASRFAVVACGGPRGCLQRSNTSMMIMRPPQQRHGGRKSSGSSDVAVSGGKATFRSLRARTRLAFRAELASKP